MNDRPKVTVYIQLNDREPENVGHVRPLTEDSCGHDIAKLLRGIADVFEDGPAEDDPEVEWVAAGDMLTEVHYEFPAPSTDHRP